MPRKKEGKIYRNDMKERIKENKTENIRVAIEPSKKIKLNEICEETNKSISEYTRDYWNSLIESKSDKIDK